MGLPINRKLMYRERKLSILNMMSSSINNRRTTPSLLTPEEVMSRFKISRATLYRLVGKRAIPFHKVGRSLRFSEDNIQEYLSRNRVDPIVR